MLSSGFRFSLFGPVILSLRPHLPSAVIPGEATLISITLHLLIINVQQSFPKFFAANLLYLIQGDPE